jgi:hypothetical protein
MGGYNMNIGGGYPYNPLTNAQQTQNTAPAVSTSIGNFDLNDPTAFLKSIGNKLSAALSPININRNELRSDINQASLDRLNIKLVDPPPVYNNYPTQGYNAPYPNQGYAQGGGQQIMPVYIQTPNGPQISGYVTTQRPQQTYPPQYGSYGGQQTYPPQYGNYSGQQTYPPQYGSYGGQQTYPPQYGSYGGQQTYPPQIEQYQPSYGYADPNFPPPNYPNTTTQEIPFPTARPFSAGNSSWLSEETTNNTQSSTANTADIKTLKQQLDNLKSTKADLKKRLDNDKLSPTEKNALNSMLDDIKQQARQLKTKIRKLGGQSVHKGRHHHNHTNKTEAPPPPATDGVLNPIVNSTIETTTP